MLGWKPQPTAFLNTAGKSDIRSKHQTVKKHRHPHIFKSGMFCSILSLLIGSFKKEKTVCCGKLSGNHVGWGFYPNGF